MATTWLGLIVGPSVAGLRLTFATPVWLCAVDAASFLVGIACVALLRRPESRPQVTARGLGERWHLIIDGVALVWRDARLHALVVSWTAFAGLAGAFSPVSQVFYLRELGFTPSEYALILGLPSIGGLAGSWVTRHGAERLGLDRTLRLASWGRSALYLLYPLLVGGTLGVVLTAVLFAATLFTTSLANSSMGAIRVRATPGTHQARVAALWSFTGMAAGPVLIAATTPALQAFGPRPVLAGICVAVALIPLLLPRATGGSAAGDTC
ncbi:MFS transporter [Arsenicicoccus dermatophilus]|uniref:MFS transporter n=1 Tax=Arsenicicoccus dermatophilus TaxID=1076331 RepID=UPI003916D9F8